MNYSSISRLIMVPVLISVTILVALNIASISKSFSMLRDFEQLEKTLVQSERDVNQILSLFKTQVQEWKNVLLRGYKPEDRDKYWQRFQQREAEIGDAFDQLLTNPHINDSIKADIRSFKQSHMLMADKYRKGYRAFVDAGADPKVGDDFVRGIDREPAKLLQKIAEDISRESAQALVDVKTSSRAILWSIAVVAVLMSIATIIYVVARLRAQVIKPVKEVARCIQDLAQNRYDRSLTYQSRHELGVLADSARSLQSKLIDTVSLLRQAEHEVISATGKLGEISNEIQDGANEQREHSQSLEVSTDKLREIVQSLVTITDQVAVATNNSQENVDSCYVTFEKANRGFIELAQTVSDSSNIVNELQSRSANILKVVNVINEIADQTNLLALNAAIEAARAGEHGRGFAVVADEVRALAAKTQQSTKEINDILTSFERDARSAVSAMESGRSLSEANASEAASALQTLTKVVKDIQETSSVVVALNAAADEQEAVLGSVEGVIQAAVRGSERYQQLSQRNDISDSMRQMASNVENVVVALTKQ